MTKPAPYYQKDTVRLQFKIRSKEGRVSPQSAHVSLYWEDEEIMPQSPAEIKENVVSFVVDGKYTIEAGDYVAVFTVSFAPEIARTHKMRFRILPKGPVISEQEDNRLVPNIDKKSTDYQGITAIAHALRSLRRAGENIIKASRIAESIVQKKTNRRL